MQAYELKEHPNEKLEGFKDTEYIIHTYNDNTPSNVEQKTFYWTIWTTLMLQKNTDYYVEIDCPNIDSYDYKLIALEYIDREKVINVLNQLMFNINQFMTNTDYGYKMVYKAIDDAIAKHCVIGIGISASLGAGLYMSGAAQIVVDAHGNIGLQLAVGPGAEAGGSADVTIYSVFYPGMDSINDVEGFGMEVGGSIGEAFIASVSVLLAGEGDDLHPVGIMGGLGIGGEVTFLEGHIAMSGTFPTIYLGNLATYSWDKIYENWGYVYTAWEMLYSLWNKG